MADEEDNLNLSELDTSTKPVEDDDAELAAMDVALPERDTQLASIQDLEAVYDIPVQVSAVLGKSSMQVSQILKLGRGAVVELDRKVGEAVDIYVNNRLVARGEVVVAEDNFGIRIKEIVAKAAGP